MNENMKAAVLREFHAPLQIETVPVPVPKPGEVLVKVCASGLCASDLHIMDGMISTVKPPYIPGHEMAGIVCAVGENVTRVKIGDHIISAIDVICGKCRFCRTGRTNLCKELSRIGFELNGAHAEYAVIPEDNAFPISKSIPMTQACIIPDAVVCMYHAIKQAHVTSGDRVLILGAGGLGLQGVQIAKHFGAEVYATSRQDAKLKIAKQFGADYIINTATHNLYGEIRRFTDDEMCDVIFDNIGLSNTVEDCLPILRPGGKLVLVGYSQPEFTAGYQHVINREKEIIGIRGSVRQELTEVIRLVEKGIITPYVQRSYPLERINDALDELRNGNTLSRTVIEFNTEEWSEKG